ncbi:hypothetical protein BWK59_00635 [Flavobacterium davisii]|uniref:RteC protein n=1 Tax=Flavobacterium davisii TaxID=2906077 RepID=A0A246GLI5_9FLAO|nr:RteC domain-containing protein [Flavobacterium davisii]OWP85279.1 hypothetical protein BWK59_00635 [Flavobacterium davisii]
MKDNITRFSQEELAYFETDYFNKLMKYLSENKNKTDSDFIKNELKKIENEKKEIIRIQNLSDEIFFEEIVLGKGTNPYKRAIDSGENKEFVRNIYFERYPRNNNSEITIPNSTIKKEAFYKFKLQSIQKNLKQEKKLNWQGNALEFSELVKALIESKLLNPELKQYEIYELMRKAFNVEKFDEGQKNKEIKNRSKTSTILINRLETSLINWIKKK